MHAAFYHKEELMRLETSRFSGANGSALPYYLWTPEIQPWMIVQITHGMTEHTGRYESLAKELTNYGIIVAGFDLRGHGDNFRVFRSATLGVYGWDYSLEDMDLFRSMLKNRFPGLPHYMLGFSLGSFLLREYLNHYPTPDGAIFIGTGAQSGIMLSILMKIIKREIGKSSFNESTALVQKLSFETYNKKFKETRTHMDWMCSDSMELASYLTDIHCRSRISSGLFYQLLASMKRSGKEDAYARWNKSMPILLVSGLDDPVGNMGKGVRTVLTQMERAGFTNLQMHLLPHARHDVLHEEISGAARDARNLIFHWLLNSHERSVSHDQ